MGIAGLDTEFFDLSIRDDGSVLDVVVNRPPVNALVKECYEELLDICRFVSDHATIAVMLIRSEGRIFSAGADVKALQGVSESYAAGRRDLLFSAIVQLFTCAVPVVTAVNGAAVGAGAVLAAAGDLIIMSEDGYISLPEVNIGLVGGARGVSRVLSPPQVRSLALTGERLDAMELYRTGVVREVVPNDQLQERAFEYASLLAGKGYHTMRKWKRALTVIDRSGLEEGLLMEQSLGLSLSALNSGVATTQPHEETATGAGQSHDPKSKSVSYHGELFGMSYQKENYENV